MSTVLTGTVGAAFVGSATAPQAGNGVTAASIQNPIQACLNDAAFLNADKFSQRLGGTIEAPTSFTADVEIIAADLEIQNGSSFSAQAGSTVVLAGTTSASGTVTISGATTHSGVTKFTGRTVDRAPVYRGDVDFTLDQSTGANRVIMTTPPAANRVITLRQSSAPVPENGDWFEVTVLLGTSEWTVVLKREGSVEFVAVMGAGVAGVTGNQIGTARVQLVGGVWRLVAAGGRYVFYGADS